MNEETEIVLTKEQEEKGNNWLRGNIKHYRELKKRLDDMFTKKQQKYLDKLEAYAKENNIEV